MDNLTLLVLRKKEFCLRLRPIPPEHADDIREKIMKSLVGFIWIGRKIQRLVKPQGSIHILKN